MPGEQITGILKSKRQNGKNSKKASQTGNLKDTETHKSELETECENSLSQEGLQARTLRLETIPMKSFFAMTSTFSNPAFMIF
jgi:hypothetical protein